MRYGFGAVTAVVVIAALTWALAACGVRYDAGDGGWVTSMATADVGAKVVRVTEARKVVVRGCGAEDGCAIDYKPSGKWVVKKVQP